jgi:penicillin-binding protein
MRKVIYILIGSLFFLALNGCGNKEQPNPNEQMADYVDHWVDGDFTAMYDMLSEETRTSFQPKDFIDRYEKVYHDLEITHLKVSPTNLNVEEVESALEDGETKFNLSITMQSIAGEIAFDRTITLTLQEFEEKEKDSIWGVVWDEGFIFPGLEDGGKLAVNKEQPRRGEIRDRNEIPLAMNDTAYEIGIVQNLIEDETSEINEIAKLLHMTADQIHTKLDAEWVQPDFFVPLKTIPKTAETQLTELIEIPGVTTKEQIGRVYPSGEATAHLTGYIGAITAEELEKLPKGKYSDNDVIGKRGLEQLFEDDLHGEEGVTIVISHEGEDGDEEREILAEKPVQDGEHVQLSIDVNVQEKIFHSYEGKAGTAAAIQPKTGEVLALVSSPSFDPNELTYGITQSRWDELMDDPDQPFINRFSATFAPGSVLKPITAAVGLHNGTITHDEGIEINGLTWGKENWGDAKVTRVSTTDKPVTLKTALTKSDNIYFAMKAVEMGSEQYMDGMKQFGFTKDIPFAYPITASQISNDDKLDEILLAHTSYGQGQIEMSALHLALAYTPFLNKGNMLRPVLLKEDEVEQIWKKGLLSEEDAEKMADYLRAVVSEGTGSAAKDEELAISGKTGTAELKLAKDTDGHQNGWFVGYPTKDEDIIIAMMMEKVEDVGASGYVTGKVKDVLKEIKMQTE